ncbi:hypothetical protein ACLESD_11705 [Pyxidicoccus sp. 3LFB2]
MRQLLALVLLATAWSAQAAGDGAAPLKLWHAYRGGEETALIQVTERFTARRASRWSCWPCRTTHTPTS